MPRYSSDGSSRRGPPRSSRIAEMAVEPATLHVLVEPRLQPRPLAQQRFVSDLDAVAVDGQQPAGDQRLDGHTGFMVAADDLAERQTAPQVDGAVVPRIGQAQQHTRCAAARASSPSAR